MFLDSSKVKVIETNLSKDRKGPVAQSLGYVIPHTETFRYITQDIYEFIAHPENKIKKPFTYEDGNKKNLTIGTYKSKDFLYIFQLMEVFFTKFGKEQQTRCERKPVINVFPFPRNENSLPENYLSQDLSERLTSHALDTLCNDKEINKTPSVCILVPYYTDKLIDITEDKKEYRAWCLSVLQNKLLHLYVATSGDNNFFNSHRIYRIIRDSIQKAGKATSLDAIEMEMNNDKKAVVSILRKLLISMVNNYDVQSRVLLRDNNWPDQFNEAPVENKAEFLGSQAWKIGFSSNKNIMSIYKGSAKKVANRFASVQQDLLTKSNSV